MTKYGEPWSIILLDDQYAEVYAEGYKPCSCVPLPAAERIVACVNACQGRDPDEIARALELLDRGERS